MINKVIERTPIHQVYDAVANKPSKTWVVPVNEQWKLNFLHVIYTSDATTGNRQIMLEIIDSDGNVLANHVAGAVQAASLVRHYSFIQGIYRETSFIGDEIQVPIPQDLYLGPGYSLRVSDKNSISALDDTIVSFQVKRFTV